MTNRTLKRIDALIELFKKHNPTDCLEAERVCDITLLPIPDADGTFRDVYYIKGYPLVVKFPKKDGDGTRNHARAEIRTVRHVLKSKRKYKVLHSYMPKIYYGNLRTGVIVMQRYKPYGYRQGNRDRHSISKLIRQLCDSIWPHHKTKWNDTNDIGTNNIGKDDKGYPVIIDLGYFLPEGQTNDSDR